MLLSRKLCYVALESVLTITRTCYQKSLNGEARVISVCKIVFLAGCVTLLAINFVDMPASKSINVPAPNLPLGGFGRAAMRIKCKAALLTRCPDTI
ncbi:MAG: hypothetical protein KME19_23580 [Microcoleus vaginatus WJT46-NPBG5]|nr:hypothetical protein [Microcoleus vaginatus WJT46-NPBG5]